MLYILLLLRLGTRREHLFESARNDICRVLTHFEQRSCGRLILFAVHYTVLIVTFTRVPLRIEV